MTKNDQIKDLNDEDQELTPEELAELAEQQKQEEQALEERRKLEELIREEYTNVRKVFANPPIKGPELDKDGTASFEFLKKLVHINPGFVEKLAKHKDTKAIIRGLFSHEFGHYFNHPYTLALHMWLSHAAQKEFKEHAQAVYGFFTDFQNNILTYNRDFCRKDLATTLEATVLDGHDPVFTALCLGYKEHGMELSVEMSEEPKKARELLAYVTELKENGFPISLNEEYEERIQEFHAKVIQKELTEEIKKMIEEDSKNATVSKTTTTSIGGIDVPSHLIGPVLEEFSKRMEEPIDYEKIISHIEKYKAKVEHIEKLILETGSELKTQDVSPRQDRGFQESIMYKFGRTIMPLLELKDDEDQKKKNGSGKGNGTGEGGQGQGISSDTLITPELIDGLSPAEKKQLKEALTDLVLGKCGQKITKGQFEELKKHFFPDENKPSQQGHGIGLGETDVSNAEKDTVDTYTLLAKKCGTYMRPKRIPAISTTPFVFGQTEFQPGDDPSGIDTVFSGGKILPGLTLNNDFTRVPELSVSQAVPNLILYKDASGSEPDPRQTICYGTIAATILALSYIQSGSTVGIALFDGETTPLLVTRDPYAAVQKLCSYKGGGTVVNIPKLLEHVKDMGGYVPRSRDITPEELRSNPMLRQFMEKQAHVKGQTMGKNLTDFVIMTDGGIANVYELLTFFGEHPEYRPTIIHNGGGFGLALKGYNGKSGDYQGVRVLRADSGEDCIAIAKKHMQDRLIK